MKCHSQDLKKALIANLVAALICIIAFAIFVRISEVDNKKLDKNAVDTTFTDEEQVGLVYRSVEDGNLKVGVTSEALFKVIKTIVGSDDNLVRLWDTQIENEDGKIEYNITQDIAYVICYGNEDTEIDLDQFDGLSTALVNVSNVNLEDLRYDVSVKTGAIVLEEDEQYNGLKYQTSKEVEIKKINNLDKTEQYYLAEDIYNIIAILDIENRRIYENNFVHYANILKD